jgi:hypothetical protein
MFAWNQGRVVATYTKIFSRKNVAKKTNWHFFTKYGEKCGEKNMGERNKLAFFYKILLVHAKLFFFFKEGANFLLKLSSMQLLETLKPTVVVVDMIFANHRGDQNGRIFSHWKIVYFEDIFNVGRSIPHCRAFLSVKVMHNV